MASGRSVDDTLIVGIDARLRSGKSGGVEQFIIGLASGLSRLTDGQERYLFLTYPGEEAWLRPYLGRSCRLVPRPWFRSNRPKWVASLSRRSRGALARWRAPVEVPDPRSMSDGTLETLGARVIHFPMQSAFVTELPTIYHPWDLQHLHLPDFFSRDVIADRERWYRLFCDRAAMVVAATSWVKDDLVEKYRLPPSKISVIPVPPPIDAYAPVSETTISEVRRHLALPDQFVFYPAQTWPHKNHIRLLRALALIRDRHGIEIALVCSGLQNDHYADIAAETTRLRLDHQVRFLGFVSAVEVQALYRSSRALVFPSLFEGWGLPVVEAFSTGLPVACARVTSLPELVGDAALLFDPYDANDIGEAVMRIWTDERLRREMSAKGQDRVRDADWTHTARVFRAHYRTAAQQNIEPDDVELLEHEARGWA